MSSSVHPPDSVPVRPASRPLWSVQLGSAPRGLSLAREAGSLLTWDETGSLYLVNRGGELQGRTRLPGGVVSACHADDGTACAAIGERGAVAWLTPDLMPRWERSVPRRAVACAIDPFGQYLAVSDATGGLHLFDRTGKRLCQTETARPLIHLAFVPEAPRLIGCADFGLVTCLDPACRCVWRDGLVANIGALAVSGDGGRILLACFSEGLRSYALDGKKKDRLPVGEPCRLVALSYDGKRTLVCGLGARLLELDREGQIVSTPALDAPPVALGLAALGETAYLALADGQVLALGLS